MSAGEWKPGDVALLSGHASGPHVAMVRPRRGRLEFAIEDGGFDLVEGFEDETYSARPLVVIDPEDREQVERLADLLTERSEAACNTASEVLVSATQTALRQFANPTQPRPDEPTTWGVVEAACCHSDDRTHWVRHPDGNWWPAYSYGATTKRAPLPDCWDDLINPVVIREGVQP